MSNELLLNIGQIALAIAIIFQGLIQLKTSKRIDGLLRSQMLAGLAMQTMNNVLSDMNKRLAKLEKK